SQDSGARFERNFARLIAPIAVRVGHAVQFRQALECTGHDAKTCTQNRALIIAPSSNRSSQNAEQTPTPPAAKRCGCIPPPLRRLGRRGDQESPRENPLRTLAGASPSASSTQE